MKLARPSCLPVGLDLVPSRTSVHDAIPSAHRGLTRGEALQISANSLCPVGLDLASSRARGASPAPNELPLLVRAFTLLELLVVVGLMAVFALVLADAVAGGGKAAALQAGQALVANLVTAARTQAMATGHRARLLVNADPSSGARFRRALALQEETAAGTWVSRTSCQLPNGIYLVPYSGRVTPGLLADSSVWIKLNGSGPLESSALSAAPLSVAVDVAGAETWEYVQFVPAGTVSGSGNLVLATGRPRPPGTWNAGESPVQLEGPDAVRGVVLSAYGLPRMIDDRRGFQ